MRTFVPSSAFPCRLYMITSTGQPQKQKADWLVKQSRANAYNVSSARARCGVTGVRLCL